MEIADNGTGGVMLPELLASYLEMRASAVSAAMAPTTARLAMPRQDV
ncbi:MAG: hypothetical protein JSR83_24475 [Proteobacteria bacterium]|nr:hypothetical protein [Pseudomonadota bacterium]